MEPRRGQERANISFALFNYVGERKYLLARIYLDLSWFLSFSMGRKMIGVYYFSGSL